MTIALLVILAVAAVGAVAVQEYLVSVAASRSLRVRALRWGLLIVALGASVAAGRQAPDALRAWRRAAPPVPIPFDHAGDPTRLRALQSQRPQHPFPAASVRDEAGSWRQSVLRDVASRTGLDFDSEPHLLTIGVTIVETQMVGDLRRTLIRFDSWDGTRIPAYVFEPPGSAAKRAVLVVPGHGLGVAATAGLADEYQHGAALELARRGFVTLTPELRGFGMLAPEGVAAHRLVAAAALAEGTSYKAVVGRDLSRALTVLQQWKGVDPARVGVTGTSIGGELAVLLAALDSRVKATVSNSYGGAIGVQDEDASGNDETDQTPHGCHTMPGINQVLLQEDWVRLIAPRPVLVVRGDRNTPRTIDVFERLVLPAFRAHGATDRFRVAVEPGGHEFYPAVTAEFLQRWL